MSEPNKPESEKEAPGAEESLSEAERKDLEHEYSILVTRNAQGRNFSAKRLRAAIANPDEELSRRLEEEEKEKTDELFKDDPSSKG